MKALYSTDPAAQVRLTVSWRSADADVNFWLGLKARSMKLEIVAVLDRPKGTSVVFKADVAVAEWPDPERDRRPGVAKAGRAVAADELRSEPMRLT